MIPSSKDAILTLSSLKLFNLEVTEFEKLNLENKKLFTLSHKKLMKI